MNKLTSVVLIMVTLLGGMDSPPAHAASSLASPEAFAPAPDCSPRIEIIRFNSNTIRILAFTDDINYFLPGPHGLMHVGITRNGRVLVDGDYNVSIYGPFDKKFTAGSNATVSIALTNDANTTTYCQSTRQR